jgi:hypothetical protein
MSKMEVHDRVFPFVCNNTECGHKFDLNDFVEVIQFWGFIFMINQGNMLMGITCPHCQKTTIRKYPSVPVDFSIPDLSSRAGFTSNYVPFSYKILLELSLVDFEKALTQEHKNPYGIPYGFPLLNICLSFINDTLPIMVEEHEVPILLDIENNNGLKAFPRVVPDNSVYRILDWFLIYCKMPHAISENDARKLNGMLATHIDSTRPGSMYCTPEVKTRYSHLIVNNLTDNDYRDMFVNGEFIGESIIWESFIETISEFLGDYAKLRNHIDFEIIHKNELINKYARLLYVNPGSFEANRAEMENHSGEPPEEYVDYNMQPVKIEQPPAIPESHAAKKDRKEEENPLADAIENEHLKLKNYNNVFFRKGKVWYIKFKGKSDTVEDNLRIHYVAHLLKKPLFHYNNLQLFQDVGSDLYKQTELNDLKDSYDENGDNKDDSRNKLADGLNSRNLGDLETEEIRPLSSKKIVEYKKIVHGLLEEKQNALDENQHDRINEIDQEIFVVRIELEEYKANLVIGKNDETGETLVSIKKRGLTKREENARTTVRNNLNNAYKTISKISPKLERHLRQCIETKMSYAVYDPQKSKTDKSVKWYISF